MGSQDDLERLLGRPIYYRMDGTPYPSGEEGLMQWCEDFKNTKARIIGRTELPWGGRVSTVWLGMDHSFGGGRPLIFESMLFNPEGNGDLDVDRYATIEEAKAGHEVMVKKHWDGPVEDRR